LIFCLIFSIALSGYESGKEIPVVKSPSTNKAIYKIGMSKIDITPDVEFDRVNMHCYFDRRNKTSTGVHDPLFAKAVVIEDSMGALFVLVSADICYINNQVRDRVISRIRRLGFNEHNVMLAGTHTHSGPCGYDKRFVSDTLFGRYKSTIFEMIVRGISSAIIQAAQNREPANIFYGSKEAPGLNRSRRDPAFDISTGGGPSDIPFNTDKYKTDTTLSVVMFKTLDDKPIGLIYNFASHPTVMSPKNMLISADWPGVAGARLEKEMGRGTAAIFINGALGDAAPNPDWTFVNKEWEDMEAYGLEIARAVLEVKTSLKPMTAGKIKGRTVRKNFERLALRAFKGWKMPKSMSKLALSRTDQPLQAARVGNVVFLAVPGEPTTTVGARLKELCDKDYLCLVTAPSNSYLGYFVLEKEWKEGGYAANSCMFGLDGTYSVIHGITKAYDLVK